jgi:hypothetical protein
LINKCKDKLVLFLEEHFAASHAERLRAGGFPQVEMFRVHFPDEKRKVEQSVKDPRIIRFCDSRCWILVTTDSSMEKTHCELIKTTKIAILASAHNNADDVDEWIDGLIRARSKVAQHLKKTPKPWCATFTRDGKVNVHIITEKNKTRRKRPKEQ